MGGFFCAKMPVLKTAGSRGEKIVSIKFFSFSS
jgi:hypothetical protein